MSLPNSFYVKVAAASFAVGTIHSYVCEALAGVLLLNLRASYVAGRFHGVFYDQDWILRRVSAHAYN
jgi:hypothetical protein